MTNREPTVYSCVDDDGFIRLSLHPIPKFPEGIEDVEFSRYRVAYSSGIDDEWFRSFCGIDAGGPSFAHEGDALAWLLEGER